ncbi:hypothetical protein [Streptomyces sp. NPDC002054]|uniref:hypothetical protein n=1 Tax=Streptomyces sp. NPDC002054 TaxID=3154663 RepID=UPI00332F13F2
MTKLSPGPWKWVIWAVGLVVLLVGLSTLPDFRGSEFTVVVTLGMGGWITLVAPIARVSVDARGIRYWGIFKWKRVRWAEVAAIEAQPLGGNGLMATEAVMVRTVDGRELLLAVLAGHTRGASSTNRRVRRQLATLHKAGMRFGWTERAVRERSRGAASE